MIQEIEPLLRACVWPRWLFLEDALNDASTSGDLHLSALILRTQIEELDSLRAAAAILGLPEDESWEGDEFAYAIRTVKDHILPRLQTKTDEQLLDKASSAVKFGARPPRLEQAFGRLCEYVHPNYGSHILSVRPHSVDAASVLVEAFVAVYEEFLSLPWVQEIDYQPFYPQVAGTELRSTYLVLAEDKVRALANAHPSATQMGPVPWIDAVNSFHRCEGRENSQEKLARSLESGDITGDGLDFDVEAIRSLREHSISPDSGPESINTAARRLEYAMLVESERKLTEAAEHLSPVASHRDDDSRLALMCSGLTFSMNVTEQKMRSLARQAARLINAENVLGATLVIRSMLEHHALAIELGAKLQTLWSRAERVAPSEKQIIDALDEAEKQIARVLVGSSATCEGSTAWRMLWEQTVRKHYNILGSVTKLDSDFPGFLKTYGLLSHVVHGTICTGGDLLETTGSVSKAGRSILAQLIIMLANLCDVDAMIFRQSASMMLAQKLDLADRAPRGPGERIKKMRMLEGQKLKPGRDIFGEGTLNDPFRFRDGLLYHDAYNHYLKQEEIQVRSRRVEHFENGFGDCVETEDGRTLYFLNDKFDFE